MATQTLNVIGELSKAEINHILTLRQVNQRHRKLVQNLTKRFREAEITHAELVASGLSEDEAHQKQLDTMFEQLGV